jgi:hypothetical protein
MGRSLSFVAVLLFLSSAALGQTTYENRKLNFSFPVPSGWKEVSKDILSRDYEELDEGIGEIPVTLTAFESNPMKRRTSPVVIVRYRRMKGPEMTKRYEELKSDPDAYLEKVMDELDLASVYKVGKPKYYPDKPAYRLAYSWENHNVDTIREWKVFMLGQYSIVILHFRGLETEFKADQKEIEAAIEGFEFARQLRLIREESPVPAAVPSPTPRETAEPEPLRAPDEPERPPSGGSGMVLVIMGVAVGGGILVLVVVLAAKGAGGGRRPPPRRRGSRRR